MNATLSALLDDLARFGAEHDATEGDRRRRMLNITRDTGELLAVLVRAMGARHVLELGTSNGYSTIWLADAARDTGGRVITVELLEDKAAMARENLRHAALDMFVEFVAGDAGHVLCAAPADVYDFVLLDTDRSRYEMWWPDLARVLAPGGLLVVDNALSHAAELEAFTSAVRAHPDFTTALVPVGNGELLTCKGVRSVARVRLS